MGTDQSVYVAWKRKSGLKDTDEMSLRAACSLVRRESMGSPKVTNSHCLIGRCAASRIRRPVDLFPSLAHFSGSNLQLHLLVIGRRSSRK